MNDSNETYEILSPENNSFNEFVAPTFPPIANFWRRIFALLLDYLIIGFAGFILSLPFAFLLFKIGPYGRLIGLFIILPYFGIMNSKICNGQTLGKRMLKIAVRNKNNRNISLQLSFARIAILLIPNIFANIIRYQIFGWIICDNINRLWISHCTYLHIQQKEPPKFTRYDC